MKTKLREIRITRRKSTVSRKRVAAVWKQLIAERNAEEKARKAADRQHQ